MITIKAPHLQTKIDIWNPRYRDKADGGQWIVLLSTQKVRYSSSIILVNFTKAKHLIGQRFAITREDAMKYPIESNGTIDCYAIPLDKFDSWESNAELKELVSNLF